MIGLREVVIGYHATSALSYFERIVGDVSLPSIALDAGPRARVVSEWRLYFHLGVMKQFCIRQNGLAFLAL